MKTTTINNEFDSTDKKQIGIGFFVKALWRSKWKIMTFTAAVTIIAALFILRLPSIYEAKATLYIKKENATPVSRNTAPGMGAGEYLKTQVGILQSESLALEVINKLNLVKLSSDNTKAEKTDKTSVLNIIKTSVKEIVGAPKDKLQNAISEEDINLQRALDWYRAGITIRPVKSTQLVNISFQAKDPQLAADVVNTLGEAYIDRFLSAKMQRTDKAFEWLQHRRLALSEELALAEAELQAFTQQKKIVSLDEDMLGANSDKLNNFSKRLKEVRTERIRLENIINQTRSSEVLETGMLSQLSESAAIQELSKAKLAAETTFKEVSRRYGPKHPKYIAANNELNQLQLKLTERVKSEMILLEQELSKFKQAEQSLKNEIAIVENSIVSGTGKEAALKKLSANVERLTELNELIRKRFKEFDITSDFNEENVRFVDAAKAPLYPIKPAIVKQLAIVLIISAGFACFAVILFPTSEGTFKRPLDIEEELEAKFMGGVPKIKVKRKQILPLHIYFDEEYRLFNEAIKTIRTCHMKGQLDNNAMVTLITSAVPSEGKSTLSINLAFSFGQMDRVLLIDANLCKSSLAKSFGLPAYQPGLSNVLNANMDLEGCIVKDNESGIDLLPAGHYAQNALELLTGDKFAELLGKLKNKYTKIVIDSAPCQAMSETIVLSKVVDTVIFVVKADSTEKQVVKGAVRSLRDSGAVIEGVILNGADMSKQGD